MSKLMARARVALGVAMSMVLTAPERLEEPEPIWPLSRRITWRAPLSARWKAVLRPARPAPMIIVLGCGML